jgi:hypothetical protein
MYYMPRCRGSTFEIKNDAYDVGMIGIDQDLIFEARTIRLFDQVVRVIRCEALKFAKVLWSNQHAAGGDVIIFHQQCKGNI